MLDNFPLSKKQVISFQQAEARINIWEGAIRSGKTFVSILKLLERIRNGEPGDVMIIGVSRASIQRNVLNDLYRLMGFAPPSSKTIQTELYGRSVYFVGASNEGSFRIIQGCTLVYAYVDEATNIPHSFFSMLLGRLSINHAQVFCTCNPEGPAHWLKKDFIDKKHELNLRNWKFTLEDNPVLSESFKNFVKKEHRDRLLYRRFILGEWTMASGLIYDSFDETNLDDDEAPCDFRIMGIDYGTHNPTAAVLIGVSKKRWPQMRVIDEFYYDSKKMGRTKTDSELADDIEKFINRRAIKHIYVDPSAASFKQELRNRNLCILDANNDVINGIRVVSKFISQKMVVINKEKCPNLLDSLYSYVWDHKASSKGEDKPLKKDDHMADALRYGIYSQFPRGKMTTDSDNMTLDQLKILVYGETNNQIF